MVKKEIIRKDALDFLTEFKDDTDTVKIISGVRRCGKSTLMLQYITRLIGPGVSSNNITYVNLESSEFREISNGNELESMIKERMGEGRNYIFIDEVQTIKGWETAINSLRVDTDSDIYLTGSNSNLLSSELATYLTGRYVSIELLPLSFKEYMEFNGAGKDRYEMFRKYLIHGAFPVIDPFDTDRKIQAMLEGLYSSIVYKDVVSRGEIRDTEALDRVVRYMMANVGNPLSVNRISQEINTDRKTTERYIRLLEEAYVLCRVDRYDIKSTYLNPKPKYYSIDTGLRNLSTGHGLEDHGRLLENVVYLELRRRRYKVRVGRYGDKEIDFNVLTQSGQTYYQVTRSMLDETVMKRELEPLNDLKDNHPRIVLSEDRINERFRDGTMHLNIVDWLLDTNEDLGKR